MSPSSPKTVFVRRVTQQPSTAFATRIPEERSYGPGTGVAHVFEVGILQSRQRPQWSPRCERCRCGECAFGFCSTQAGESEYTNVEVFFPNTIPIRFFDLIPSCLGIWTPWASLARLLSSPCTSTSPMRLHIVKP